MGVDEQFESLVQLRNTSKPLQLVCSKILTNLCGLLSRDLKGRFFENRPRNLASPLCGSLKNDTTYKNETNKKDNFLYFNRTFDSWNSCFFFWNNQYYGKFEI